MPNSLTGVPNAHPTADLSRGTLRCLLLGIRGTGMSALADILNDLHHDVIGADHSAVATDAFHRVGKILPWHVSTLQQQPVDVCIHTPALADNDPLLRAMKSRDVPVLTLHEALANVFHEHRQICVSGTHGKTTTSSMLTWILQQCGRSPSAFVGGEMLNAGRSGVMSDGDEAVIESCEFSTAFQLMTPRVAVLTGLERDHFDRFANAADEDAAFQIFLEKVDRSGTLVVNADSPRAVAVALAAQRVHGAQLVTTSRNHSTGHADWAASEISVDASATTFQLNGPFGTQTVSLRVPGHHNAGNAVLAIATAAVLGVPVSESVAAIQEFQGVRRRFEIRGVVNGAVVVDDYGHHPTAIAETLRTARQVFGRRRLVLAFEPHQLSRTEALFAEFVSACELADETLILPVFPARETSTHLECCRMSGQLVKHLNHRNHKAFLFANLDQIVSRLDHSIRPSDVCISMGAGTTNLIYDHLTRRLQRHSVA